MTKEKYPENPKKNAVKPVQKINSGKEIDIHEFDDDKFNYECPKCKFKFNRK
ncbi:MAG: hypothetical protein NC177_14325 [Ruminococcus flavefaciens]|nr:hypothetical protein [Ruminococcus flavefaciens]